MVEERLESVGVENGDLEAGNRARTGRSRGLQHDLMDAGGLVGLMLVCDARVL